MGNVEKSPLRHGRGLPINSISIVTEPFEFNSIIIHTSVKHPLMSTVIAAVTIHIITGISIGIISGIFLYKTNILNISKPSNGLYYGLLAGTLVYLIFAVEQFVLNPEIKVTVSGVTSNIVAS